MGTLRTNRIALWSICLAAGVLVGTLGNTVALAQDEEFIWEEFRLEYHRSPTLGLYYGFTTSSLDGLNQSLAAPGFGEFKIGGSRLTVWDEEANILKYRFEYFTGTVLSSNFTKTPSTSDIAFEQWRFGIGWLKGLGYGFGSEEDEYALRGIVLNNAGAVSLASFKVLGGVTDSLEKERLSSYEGALRLGFAMEAGLTIQPVDILAIDAGFERAIIFRRIVFWETAMSAALEGVGQGLIDHFIRKVMRRSPTAAPIVSFLLKNGLSYGFYELRKKDMNWPFGSEPGLLHDTFKVGISFRF